MNAKRTLDLALLLPVSPLVALGVGALGLVSLIAHGRPIFFSQLRVGRGGRPFRIHKLRTMTREANPSERRPTRWGLWLRRRGLDELPQLWDVLRGEMSLVGPRPLTAIDADRLIAAHRPFVERYLAAPGLTGLAQISGARGVVATTELDRAYVRGRSTWMDIQILLRTVWINIVGKENGYRRPRGRPLAAGGRGAG